jgi:hypothetical protein
MVCCEFGKNVFGFYKRMIVSVPVKLLSVSQNKLCHVEL